MFEHIFKYLFINKKLLAILQELTGFLFYCGKGVHLIIPSGAVAYSLCPLYRATGI
jgi:hypothetical protein